MVKLKMDNYFKIRHSHITGLNNKIKSLKNIFYFSKKNIGNPKYNFSCNFKMYQSTLTDNKEQK